MPKVGDLVRCTDGTWMTLAPTHCPNGHPLGPRRELVGHAPCSCGVRGGHTSWQCQECDAVTYGPPLSAGCRPLDGPAEVRA
ncbi:hypothetical protein A5717_25890 [Mycolicibacterium porcinum]|nr:hypothetical protein A5717_25890 [Mycolicibacterium porcinum]